ncbi:type IV pilus modification protein PilV [Aquabacterium sp.]|uniref:type IV pilus modification protein PilV n=1 Tax=Aquabacterium sp. TaxID=1872578 RepID=UPI0035B22AC4
MMTDTRQPQHRHQQVGATLIEVLVSILLMALGILAMAAMQANAVQYGKTSEMRSLATLLANDLADRMRANHPEGQAMSAYNITGTYSAPTSMPTDASTSCEGKTITCTYAQMAAYDLAEWKKQLYRHLPQGTAYVRAVSNQVDIWIVWTDPAAAVDLTADSCPTDYAASGTVRCMYFRVAL